jgi:hypothetical protein
LFALAHPGICIEYDRDVHGTRLASGIGSSFRGLVVSNKRLITELLDVMEWDRPYEAVVLKSMFPDISMDTLREALHALWIERRVERVGVSSWRRQESRWDGRPVPAPNESTL